METLWLKKCLSFFELEIFVDKTIFNLHAFNKINDFATTQYSNTINCPFYLKS